MPAACFARELAGRCLTREDFQLLASATIRTALSFDRTVASMHAHPEHLHGLQIGLQFTLLVTQTEPYRGIMKGANTFPRYMCWFQMQKGHCNLEAMQKSTISVLEI